MHLPSLDQVMNVCTIATSVIGYAHLLTKSLPHPKDTQAATILSVASKVVNLVAFNVAKLKETK